MPDATQRRGVWVWSAKGYKGVKWLVTWGLPPQRRLGLKPQTDMGSKLAEGRFWSAFEYAAER